MQFLANRFDIKSLRVICEYIPAIVKSNKHFMALNFVELTTRKTVDMCRETIGCFIILSSGLSLAWVIMRSVFSQWIHLHTSL